MYGSVGKTAVAGRELSTNQAILGINVTKPELLHLRYLHRWFDHQQPALIAGARGVTQKNISATIVRSLKIALPPLGEQRRIATILDKADAIRRKRQETIQLTEELLQSLYVHTVGSDNPKYLTWQPRSIASLAMQRKGSIRSGPFGSALKHSEFVDKGIAVLGIDNAVQNRFAWGQRRYITEEKYVGLTRYRVYPQDVIVTIMGTTGRSAVVPDSIPESITTKHLATITLNQERALPEYVSQAIHRDPFLLRQISVRNRGAIMAGLNLGLIKELKLRVPPLKLQRRFQEEVTALRAVESRLSQVAGETDDLFNSLVQRAFRGNL